MQMLTDIRFALNGFQPHGLNDLNKANLMSRVDTKYVFHISQLPTLLAAVDEDYSVLEIDGRRMSRYSSLYYDTTNLLFYSMHQRGCSNRHKVRVRHYVDSQEKFLEVKFKNNKGRTIKKRREIGMDEAVGSQASREFMAELGVPHHCDLVTSQESNYSRIALASEERGERVTIDVNLHSRLLFEGEENVYAQPDIVIAEVKQNRVSRWTPITKVIRELGIRKSRYSKYCMGMVLTTPNDKEVKKNRFKKIVRRVSTISEASVA